MFGKSYEGVIRSHWVIDEAGVVLDERIQISPEDSVQAALETLGEA
jgi:peroxiredoxin